MSNLVGKPSPSRLEALVQGALGKPSERVLVGPGPGLDAAILESADGRIMAIAEDPIFPAPGLPLEIMGWFTVHIGASDVAVTGVKPEFMTYTLLLPPGCPEEDARTIIGSISQAAKALEITIVGGHTGWYGAVTVPTVGGVTVWGTADRDSWISPGGARDGDLILMTKGPCIEAAALLSIVHRSRLEKSLSPELLDSLRARVEQISVVQDALVAFRVGGVHAMHDATEGGVQGGLWEMSTAAGIPLRVDFDRLAIPGDIAALARELNFDPWQAISEGTLLAAVDPARAAEVQRVWADLGIESFVLGRFDAGLKENTVLRDQRVQALKEPEADPFWALFFAGIQ
ncbi:AIR synthase family protein [Desulfogranum mediterraneum]|uniref:AIR synthase family protein n=1 Tax=Desulfogranum mediterraneum TaxID=160661 RepID=UPI0003FD7E57|nr:AIR synthase family protein [Desulfogranum mediterraneum]